MNRAVPEMIVLISVTVVNFFNILQYSFFFTIFSLNFFKHPLWVHKFKTCQPFLDTCSDKCTLSNLLSVYTCNTINIHLIDVI